MNKIQKIIVTLYVLLIAIGIVTFFVGDGGITMVLSVVIGTPVALILFFLWKDKQKTDKT